MTRIYNEVEIDVPQIGSGEEIYNFIVNKSKLGKAFLSSVDSNNQADMCFLASQLGGFGYTETELKRFFEYVFSEKNLSPKSNS